MKNYLPNYFGSEWSFAQFKYSDFSQGITQCVFTKPTSDLKEGIILISQSGVYERISVDYTNATCFRETHLNVN